MKKMEMTDESIMPFGKHKGSAMKDVPATYLDWLHDQPWIKKWPYVLRYIEDNREVIDVELELEGE